MPATTRHDDCKGDGCEACGWSGQVRHYFEIPAYNLTVLEEKIGRLNKKAVKLNTQPITVEVIGEHEVERQTEVLKVKYVEIIKHVIVHGETPCISGWLLVAKITSVATGEGDDAKIENLVSCVPGETVPVSYRDAGNACEHCNSQRHRKDTFVLRNVETGEHKQVGRNCLGDFLGGVSPESVLARCEWSLSAVELAGDAEEGCWGGCHGEISTALSQFVAVCAICIRKLGWVSRGVARDQELEATADIAWLICNPPHHDGARRQLDRFIEQNNLSVEEKDLELAAKAIEWGKALPTDEGDYIFNLGVGVRMGYIVKKNQGLVASLISAYNREVEKVIADRIAKEEAKDLGHEGVVKERLGFANARVVGTRSWEGHYGVTTLVRFRLDDGKGNHVNWFASGDVTDQWEVDEVYDITATVKKHDDYKGTPQTVVNRVKLGLPKNFKKVA